MHITLFIQIVIAVSMIDEGKVFGWGNNEYKQLGVVSEEPQIACPQLVDCSNMDGMVTAITAGGSFVAFLTGKLCK